MSTPTLPELRRAITALEVVAATGRQEDWLAALDPIREHTSLHEACAARVRAGDPQGALLLLQAQEDVAEDRSPRNPRRWLWHLPVLLPLGVALLGFVRCDPFGLFVERARLGPGSPACSAALSSALGDLRRELGAPFEAPADPGATLRREGTLEVSYARDGASYAFTLRVERGEAGCELVAFQRSKSEPGEIVTTYGEYGRARLPGCTCE